MAPEKNYVEGAMANISANSAPNGMVFDHWTSDNDVTFDDASNSGTSFIMPAKAVTVTATYKTADLQTYTVTFDLAGGTYTGGGELTQTVTKGAAKAQMGDRNKPVTVPTQSDKLDYVPKTGETGNTALLTGILGLFCLFVFVVLKRKNKNV